MRAVRLLLSLVGPLAAGCAGDDPITIIERWSQPFSATPASPGVGPEKRVLVALSGTAGEITTLEQGDGRKIEGPFPTFPTSHAPVASDFKLFVVSSIGRVVGLQIGSGQQLSIGPDPPLGVTSPLVLAPDGSLRVGSTSGRLFAMRPDGTAIFDVTVSGPIDSAPAVAGDGSTYAAIFTPGRLVGVSPDGTMIFDQSVGESAGGVSVSEDRVAVGHNTGVAVFERSGTEAFTHPRQARVTGTKFMSDGKLLAWGEDGIIELYDDGGDVVWSFTAGPPISTEVHVGEGGVAVFDSAGMVHLLDPDSGEERRTHDLGGAPKPQIAMGEVGFVYLTVGTEIVALDFFVSK